MNIITCVRQTPDTETLIKISGTSIETDGVKFVLGAYDEYGLEASAQLRDKVGGEVTAITVGPDRAAETLRHCLAVGADKAVHIVDNGVTGDDALAVASALASQIKSMPHDLIMVSNKGVDSDRGAVSVMLAELLGLPYIGLVTELEIEGTTVTCARDVEGGIKERFKVQLPAVISAQKGVKGEPRYASLPAIMKAKKKPIETVAIDGGVASLKKVTIEKLEYPPARPPGRMVPGDSAADKARELVRLLRDEAKVL